MQDGYITAIAALGGSVVGALTSLTTTWIGTNAQRRIDRAGREIVKREALYGKFIDEAARVYAEVLRSQTDDPALLAVITGTYNHMRMFASPAVLAAADAVITRIIALNAEPNRTLGDFASPGARAVFDPLHAFGEACRRELDEIA